MPEQPNNKISPPEGSSDEAVAAIDSLARQADDAEREVHDLLLKRAAERLTDKLEHGDA